MDRAALGRNGFENVRIGGLTMDVCRYQTPEIAKRLKINSAQAVGGAVGWNPICLIVPCHRVMDANGKLTGYGGGLRNKIALLKLEGCLL